MLYSHSLALIDRRRGFSKASDVSCLHRIPHLVLLLHGEATCAWCAMRLEMAQIRTNCSARGQRRRRAILEEHPLFHCIHERPVNVVNGSSLRVEELLLWEVGEVHNHSPRQLARATMCIKQHANRPMPARQPLPVCPRCQILKLRTILMPRHLLRCCTCIRTKVAVMMLAALNRANAQCFTTVCRFETADIEQSSHATARRLVASTTAGINVATESGHGK